MSSLQQSAHLDDKPHMKNRAGERSRLDLREAQIRTLRKHWSDWLGLLGFAVILAAIIEICPIPQSWRNFLLGFLAAALLATVAAMVFVISGSYGPSMGRLGEEATAETVTSRRRRRQGWQVINGIYLDGHGDLDHILVGPGGVFVLESKWTTGRCSIRDGSVTGVMGREPTAQAREGARKLERYLRYGPQRFQVDVQPVVVMWGPGRVHLDCGWERVSGVLVCDGPESKQWLCQLETQQLDSNSVRTIASALSSLAERQVRLPAKSPS